MSTSVIKVPVNDQAALHSTFEGRRRPSLGAVFQRILTEKNIDDTKLATLIDQWIERTGGELTDRSAEHEAKYWNMHLKDPNLSWVRFCVGLTIVGVNELTLLA
jgi:hypothetical protein